MKIQTKGLVLMVLVIGAWCAPPAPIPQGNAAWAYDVKGGQPAMWGPQIADFNTNNDNHTFSTVYSYGGDMEYYAGLTPPFQTYFNADSQEAAAIYSKIPGVQRVICVVDGRMDGGQSWSPNLSNLTVAQCEQWADVTADLYCSFDQVSGIQVDLEPFEPPYAANLIQYLKRLSSNLRSKNNNCVNDLYPNGRSLSTFLFASETTVEILEALGPNGFAIISGYDLGPNPSGVPSTPAVYGSYLVQAINQIISLAGNQYYFSLGIPAAASEHEFTNATDTNGQYTDGYPMYSATEDSYLKEVFAAIDSTKLRQNSQFLGISVWGFSSEMIAGDYDYLPSNPFVQDGEEAFLKSNL